MKKILIFSLSYYPQHVGGAEVAIKEITDRISPSEIEFHAVVLRYDSTLPEVEQIGRVLVHRIGFTKTNPSMGDLRKFPLHLNKALYQILAPIKAASLHGRYQYDGIWAMMAHSCAVPAAIFKLLYPRVPHVLTLQEGDPPEYIERKLLLLRPLFNMGFTRARVMQVISTFLGKWARRRNFTGPLEVIPNGVDSERFSKEYSQTEINSVKTKLGKKMGEVLLITTSRLVHKNALDDVIRAMPLLPGNIRFVIAGIGPDEEKLKSLAANLKVSSRVTFLGQLGHQEMPLYLKASDIFIRPSRSEGMGNSFVEAMAAGLPVIATQEGGISDFLFDRRLNPNKSTTGWAVSKDNPGEIRDAVLDIIASPERVIAVTKTALALVTDRYDWKNVARDMREKVFNRLFV